MKILLNSKKAAREEIISVRMTIEDNKTLEEIAKKNGIKKSQILYNYVQDLVKAHKQSELEISKK